jgi:hypothetical protein
LFNFAKLLSNCYPFLSALGFLKEIEGKCARIETDRMQCIRHCHGHTAQVSCNMFPRLYHRPVLTLCFSLLILQEIYRLRYGTFERIPDVVVWPNSHDQVQFILDLANKHNVVIIPFGGGTSVTEALICPEDEKRMIVSMDMKLMNRVKW